MNKPHYGDLAPIAAQATPLAESALAVIRTSGATSVELVARVFSRPERLLQAAGNTVVHGWMLDATGQRRDEVLVSVFRAPRSYTGEDALDISCHGGLAAARAVLDALEGAGFRRALPGEFTFRAFINGKMDLTRAESVMDLVAAKTDEGLRHAVGRLSGALEGEIRGVKELLVRVLAAAELFLDYSDDDGVGGIAGHDDEAEGRLPDRETAVLAQSRLRALAASYKMEKLYRDGATVVIAGRPNAGKSSLFNRLLREERSIVTDIPGTTRDWIEAWIAVDGIPLRLVDTAGLRASEDPVERIGVERSRSMLEVADCVVYALDGAAGVHAEDAAFLAGPAGGRRVIPVWNKADRATLPAVPPGWPGAAPLPVSAVTGQGIPVLAERIVALLEGRSGKKRPGTELEAVAVPVGIASDRQKALIDRALAAVSAALDLADRRQPLDLVAPELRDAVDALGEITGEVSTADILETMFGRFCVGK